MLEEGENNRKYLIFWENVSPEATRVLLNKRLFGYKSYNKIYLGAAQKYDCKRLGKGCISVPVQHLEPVVDIFVSLNVQFTIREVADFGEKVLGTKQE